MTVTPMNVLVSLHKGYGLGDAVQMSAVLRHLRKYRPHWTIYYRAERGRQKPGAGIAHHVLTYDDPLPDVHYDCEVQVVLYDGYYNHHDRPSTRVTSCLHERFGLDWDPALSRYQVEVSPQVDAQVKLLLAATRRNIGCAGNRMVAVHYLGDSDKANKDMTHAQARTVLNTIERLGRFPVLIDWRATSPHTICGPDIGSTGRHPVAGWGGDAEYNTAVIRQCEAFVGIDSGPSKCASATDTPALVVWTGHHPSPYHDPAPNTTHLVPVGYHGLKPVVNDPGVVAWFEKNYSVRQYDGDPVVEINRWLTEVLK